MLTNTTKLDELIQRARQQPEKVSPVVLARINHHLQQTGQPTIPLPWAEQTRQPFPPSPWEREEAVPSQQARDEYLALVQKHASDPNGFTSEDHQKMIRLNCLVSHINQAQRIIQKET